MAFSIGARVEYHAPGQPWRAGTVIERRGASTAGTWIQLDEGRVVFGFGKNVRTL